MKLCSKCKQTKPLNEFSKDAKSKTGLKYFCKLCSAKIAKDWVKSNKERAKKNNANWAKSNKDKKNAACARRRTAKLNRMLEWGKEKLKPEIDIWYKRAQLATIFMGEKYEVDHIEPLQGTDRSGLHVPWNLQLLTKSENRIKGNRAKT